MRLASIPKFLIGDREAIKDIAKSQDGLAVGLLLVLAAGFAREYDAEYLIKEPWHVLIPLGASLVASFLFFAMAYGIGLRRGIGPVRFGSAYRSFLALFWMTAPLALLYAIPFQRFCHSYGATVANLWMLRIVSVWRVALMTRVVSVFFGCSIAAALWCVMLVADIAMLIALKVVGLPVISFMGGIHLSDTADLINNAAIAVLVPGVLSLPVWVIGVYVIARKSQPQWTVIDLARSPRTTRVPTIVAACSVLVWFIVLPYTQAEQRLRYMTESHLRNGQIAEGLAIMSEHRQSDFPPLWDPPLRPGFRGHEPGVRDVMLAILDTEPAEWVKTVYTNKFGRWLGVEARSPWEGMRRRHRWISMESDEFEDLLSILERIPEGPQFAEEIELLSEIDQVRETFGNDLAYRVKKLVGGK